MKTTGFSIKTKIILVLVLLPFVSLSAVGFIALFQNTASLTEQGEHSLKRLVIEKTDNYDQVFLRIQQDAMTIASFGEMLYQLQPPAHFHDQRLLLPWTGAGYGSPELEAELADEIIILKQMSMLLNSLGKQNPLYTLVYVGSESGITTFNDESLVDIISELEGFDPRQRPWYTGATKAGGPILTELYVDAHTKKLTVTGAAPLYDNHGKLLGVAGIDVLLETLQNDIMHIDIEYDNEPFMINNQGRVVVSRDMEEQDIDWYQEFYGYQEFSPANLLETPNPEFNAIIKKMAAGETGIEQFTTEGGETNYLAFAPIVHADSSLGIIVPRSELVAPVQESGRLVIIAVAITMVLAVGLGLYLGRQVTEPIEELTQLVDKASKGLLEEEEIPIQRMDEVGILATAFNRMVRNLGTVIKELEKKEAAGNEL